MDLDERAAATRAYYDRVAGLYFARHDWPIQRLTTRIEERWLRRFVPAGSRVLVTAAGGGREIPALRARGCRVTALDYSAEMVRVGQRRSAETGDPTAWAVADAHDLSRFRHGHEVVLCLGAVNYFRDPARCMAEISACCRPGGLAILSSFNALHPTERATPGGGRVIRRAFTPDELTGLARAAGLVPAARLGFRVWVDRLPAAWNQPGAPRVGRAALAALIAAERLAQPVLGARRGRFPWLVARKPGTGDARGDSNGQYNGDGA